MTMNEDRENVESRRKKMKRLGQWGWEGKDVQEPVTEVRRRARLEVRLEGTCLGFFFIVLIVLHLSLRSCSVFPDADIYVLLLF